MASLKDVAKLAGVSVTTVSRVLNGSDLVKPQTFEIVQKAINDLNFKPNLLASGLRAKSSKLVGMVVPEAIHYTFASFIQYVGDYCFSKGYNLVIGNHHDDPAIEEQLVDTFYRRHIDGLIVSLVSDQSRVLSAIHQSGTPTVIIDRVMEKEKNASVMLNNYQAGRLIGDHFAALGHQKIGCITGSFYVALCRERIQGFRDALASHGIALSDRFVAEGDFQFESGIAAAQKIFRDKNDYPTAVWAQNDLMAAGALKYVRKLGLSVPENVSVAGMDDIGLASMISPALTTVSQPFAEMAKRAVDLILLQKQLGHKINKPVVINPSLVVRESTAPYSK